MSQAVTKVDQSTPDKNNSEVQGFNNSLLVALSTADTNNCVHQVNSFNNSLLVALSTADTNKLLSLLNRDHLTLKTEVTNGDYARTGPIAQRQRRLPWLKRGLWLLNIKREQLSTNWPKNSEFAEVPYRGGLRSWVFQ